MPSRNSTHLKYDLFELTSAGEFSNGRAFRLTQDEELRLGDRFNHEYGCKTRRYVVVGIEPPHLMRDLDALTDKVPSRDERSALYKKLELTKGMGHGTSNMPGVLLVVKAVNVGKYFGE